MLERLARTASLRHYAEGLADGTILTLQLILGKVPDELLGTVKTAPQEYVTEEVRAWAEQALSRAQENRV